MPRSIKRLKHRLKYVTTHKKRNILTNEIYYEDVPNSLPILGANYFVLLTLDNYSEYSECFSTFSDAKKYALVMCLYYESYRIYRAGSCSTPPVLVETHGSKIATDTPTYKFIPKRLP